MKGHNPDILTCHETFEAYAYPFIHGIDPTEVFSVKFDVIKLIDGIPAVQIETKDRTLNNFPIYETAFAVLAAVRRSEKPKLFCVRS